MDPLLEPYAPGWLFPLMLQDWKHTPPAVHASLDTLGDERGQRLEMQGEPGSPAASGFHHPSAVDDIGFPWQKNATTHRSETGTQGGNTLGHRQTLFVPHLVRELLPESCTRGNSTFSLISPSDPHQVIELPPVAMGGTHWVLY